MSTIILNQKNREAIEAVLKKIADAHGIKDVDAIHIALDKDNGLIKYKIAVDNVTPEQYDAVYGAGAYQQAYGDPNAVAPTEQTLQEMGAGKVVNGTLPGQQVAQQPVQQQAQRPVAQPAQQLQKPVGDQSVGQKTPGTVQPQQQQAEQPGFFGNLWNQGVDWVGDQLGFLNGYNEEEALQAQQIGQENIAAANKVPDQSLATKTPKTQAVNASTFKPITKVGSGRGKPVTVYGNERKLWAATPIVGTPEKKLSGFTEAPEVEHGPIGSSVGSTLGAPIQHSLSKEDETATDSSKPQQNNLGLL